MGRNGSAWVKGKGYYTHTTGEKKTLIDSHAEGWTTTGKQLTSTQSSAWTRLRYAQEHGTQISLKEYRQATIDALAKKGYIRVQDYGDYIKVSIRPKESKFRYTRNQVTAQQQVTSILNAINIALPRR